MSKPWSEYFCLFSTQLIATNNCDSRTTVIVVDRTERRAASDRARVPRPNYRRAQRGTGRSVRCEQNDQSQNATGPTGPDTAHEADEDTGKQTVLAHQGKLQ